MACCARSLPSMPVLEDAGDQRPLVVEDRLALDHRGERQDLVEVSPRAAGRPSGRRSRRWNPSSMSRTSSSARRVGQDAVGRRPEEALERRAVRAGPPEPRVVGEQLRGGMLGELVEVRRVHLRPSIVSSLAVICSSRRPVRRRDVHVRVVRRLEQRGRRARRASSFLRRMNVPGASWLGQVALGREEDERAPVA